MLFTNAQSNLVSNPSFEDIDSCYGEPSPLGIDIFQWSGCFGWRNPTYASADLWCENPVFGNYSPPDIGLGFQYPKTGKNMAAIFITENIFQTYREYIQNELLLPLEANKYYQLSFYVNSGDIFNYTSDIGVYISNNAISQLGSYSNLLFSPQIKNPSNNFITDTMGWQKVSGIYKAVGGEKYLTIGCFDDSASIILSNYDPLTAGGVYLFLDDFIFEESQMELVIPNVFSPNADGLNDVFSISVENVFNWKCTIYNRWGEKLFELNEKNKLWDGADAVDGIYFYIFSGETEDEEIKENGFLQLLR
jgi:gliding motility-associated-like protein